MTFCCPKLLELSSRQQKTQVSTVHHSSQHIYADKKHASLEAGHGFGGLGHRMDDLLVVDVLDIAIMLHLV